MNVTYTGPSPAVMLPNRIVVERDETVEVDDDLGARLVEQDGWTKAKKAKKAKPTADADDLPDAAGD